ncbi:MULTISPECIES: phage tail protein [Pseudomonas]|jgi:microcystin-dependent protein|uniref:Phage tail protein n=1 Tax=Pseudomonas mosselii TaxID=78327 RepID=A0A5R8ZI20_9PSED|nr:tail fiber protein [Pseudomonas mosselii]TLP65411.1 phage tail protein [Pseudomonas mosselii]
MEPFIGEVRLFPYQYIPQDWALCNGATLSITTNQALFAVIGTTYGGDGRNTFMLPNLNGRAAVGAGAAVTGTNWPAGTAAGGDTLQLTVSNLPPHNHTLNVVAAVKASTAINTPANNVVPTQPTRVALYSPAPNTSLSPSTLATAGNSQPIYNMQPFLTLVYCIATTGIFPPHQ